RDDVGLQGDLDPGRGVDGDRGVDEVGHLRWVSRDGGRGQLSRARRVRDADVDLRLGERAGAAEQEGERQALHCLTPDAAWSGRIRVGRGASPRFLSTSAAWPFGNAISNERLGGRNISPPTAPVATFFVRDRLPCRFAS